MLGLQEVDQLGQRWDEAEGIRTQAAASVAARVRAILPLLPSASHCAVRAQTGGVETLLRTNDQLTSQLHAVASQVEALLTTDAQQGHRATSLSGLLSP